MKSNIPGLKSIKDEVGPNGITRLVFDIEDDKVEEFFASFGLVSGDVEGLHAAVTKAIETELARTENKQET